MLRKLLELELYSPKERDGLCFAKTLYFDMCFSVRWRPPSVFVFCLLFFGLCFYPVFCGSVFCVKIICFSCFTCFSYLGSQQASGHYNTRADRRSRPDEAMFACDPKPVNPMVPGSSMNLVSLTAQGRYKIVTRDFWRPFAKLKMVKGLFKAYKGLWSPFNHAGLGMAFKSLLDMFLKALSQCLLKAFQTTF